MSIDVAKYLGREFDWKTYNCWDFVRDVWRDHCGVDLGARTPPSGKKADMERAFDEQLHFMVPSMAQRLDMPVDPCIVLMVRPGVLSHVGVFTQNRLLHLQPRGNVMLQDIHLATIGFKELRFYA